MNIVDSLVVTLGLDSAKFTEGSKKTRDDLKNTRENANQAAKEIAASGKQAAEFFGKLRNEALSLAAVFVGGMGVKAFVSNITTADAALGRASKNLGIATETLSAWGQVAERNGGSVDGLVTSFEHLNEEMQSYNRGQGSSITPLLQRLGINSMSELEDIPSALIKIADTLNKEIASGRTSRGQAQSLLAGLGLDPGIRNAMLSGTKEFAKQIQEALALGNPTEKSTKAAIALEQAFLKTKQAVKDVGRTILTDFEPEITHALEQIDAWLGKDENREWLKKQISEGVESIKQFGREVDTVVQALGGWKAATELLFALWVGGKFVKVIANLTRLLTLLAAVPGSGVTAAVLTRLGLLSLPVGAAALAGITAPSSTGADIEGPSTVSKAGGAFGEWMAHWLLDHGGGPSGSSPSGRLPGPRAPNSAGGSEGGSQAGPPVPYEPGQILGNVGATSDQYNAFKNAVASIDAFKGDPNDPGGYSHMGGSSNRFAGRYQMGASEIAETARRLFEKAPTREEFLANPAMQERYFEAYTNAHHQQLMASSAAYRAMSPAERLAILGYAHNQGAGGASEYLRTGVVGRDAFHTGGDAYVHAVQAALARSRATTAPSGTGPRPIGGYQPDPALIPQPGARSDRSGNTDNSRRSEMSIGQITVHTAATDAPGVARAIGPAIEKATLASQANTGLA